MTKVALPFGADTSDNKREYYRQGLARVGLEYIENPPTLDGLSGLLLTGGIDIDPALYGAERRPETERIDPARDAMESGLLREALERDMPVLAICRGQQLLNIVCGGTLTQHIEGHRFEKLDHHDAHTIFIEADSRLGAILKQNEYVVNSFHHQCVDRVGDNLAVSARDPAGVVEALELPGKHFVVAVQWHPERRLHGPDARLFEAFRDSITS